jgi:hypothetical protein
VTVFAAEPQLNVMPLISENEPPTDILKAPVFETVAVVLKSAATGGTEPPTRRTQKILQPFASVPGDVMPTPAAVVSA